MDLSRFHIIIEKGSDTFNIIIHPHLTVLLEKYLFNTALY